MEKWWSILWQYWAFIGYISVVTKCNLFAEKGTQWKLQYHYSWTVTQNNTTYRTVSQDTNFTSTDENRHAKNNDLKKTLLWIHHVQHDSIFFKKLQTCAIVWIYFLVCVLSVLECQVFKTNKTDLGGKKGKLKKMFWNARLHNVLYSLKLHKCEKSRMNQVKESKDWHRTRRRLKVLT